MGTDCACETGKKLSAALLDPSAVYRPCCASGFGNLEEC